MKRIYCLLTALILLAIPLQSSAIGFKISPVTFRESAYPGDKLNRTLRIVNKGATSKAEILVQDFLGRDESGSPVYVDTLEGDTSKFTLSSWVSFPEDLVFKTEEEKLINFTIDVPENAEPGGHYATIFVQQKTGGVDGVSSVGTISRVGALIFLRVEGATVEDARINSFNAPEDKISDDEITFVTNFINLGNVHLVPEGKIYVNDSEGNPVKGIGLKPILNSLGMVERVEKVDYLFFNREKRLTILPKQTRDIETIWNKGEINGDFSAYVEIEIGQDKRKIKSQETFVSVREGIEAFITVDKSFTLTPPLNFNIEINNIGTTKLKEPKARLNIFNMFGAKVEEYDLEIGSKEIIKEEGKIDRTILKLSKGESQKITIPYEDLGFFGKYTAKVIDLKTKQTLSETSYWAGTMISFILLIGGTIFIFLILLVVIKNYLKMKKLLDQKTVPTIPVEPDSKSSNNEGDNTSTE